MKYRFAPGDAGEMRQWTAAVRAAVQRLAQPSTVDSEFTVLGTGPAVVAIGEHAQELADAGLSVIALSGVDRSREAELVLEGRSALALAVDEALAAVRWFHRQGEESVALYGKGDGGAVALHAAIILSGTSPVAIEGYTDMRQCGLPGILRYADLPDLYAALAPRPLWTDYPAQTLADAYKAFEATDKLASGSVAEFLKNRRAVTYSVPPLRVYFDTPARLEVSDRIDQVLSSGMLTQGKLVVEFEELAKRWIPGEPVAVSTGTAALDIAYQLLGVAGKTVLAPVNTFFATAASIERMGGKVDFVDIELDGFGMDPQALREALERHDESEVAAVVVVHIGGVVAPSFREILAECTARGIPVIEDTAHALGSTLDGQLAGTFGVMGTYSLHPAKVATSGEGGFFVAQDPAHTEAARKLRDHGKISIDKNIHDRLGNNWRLSEVHAAVGLAHFAQLAEMLRMRRELAAWYDEHIDSVPRVTRYAVPAGVQSNYYKYVAFLDPGVDRADLKARLRQRHGVSLAGEVYDVLLSNQPYFAPRFAGRDFEKADWFTRHHICLPAFPSMTTAEQRHVLGALRSELS